MHNDLSKDNQEVISVNVLELLRFFDEKVEGSQGHATAIAQVCGEDLGASLFLHYMKSNGIKAEIFSKKCTPGTRSGSRLDRWIKVTKDKKNIFYQTEIKNWSAHAIGGKILRVDATPVEIANHKIERWISQWDSDNKTFRYAVVNKVLKPMKKPEENSIVRPLVIHWYALHPQGSKEAFFSVDVKNATFNQVWIFSMSCYLRQIKSKTINLKMPDTIKRLQWLTRIFQT